MATFQNPKSVFLANNLVNGLIGINGTSPTDSAWQLQFASGTSPTSIALVTTNANSFDWEPLTGAIPPNLTGFKNAIFSDTTLTFPVKMQLQLFANLLQANIANIPACQAAWQGMIEDTTDFAWLTSGVASIVENYATEFNIPLVS